MPKFTDSDFQEICTVFSSERLQPYLDQSENITDALEIYRINILFCEALYPSLQTFEIALRNTIDSALKRKYGEDWYCNGKLILNKYATDEIQKCIIRIKKQGKVATTGQITATLTLGFWKQLFNKEYMQSIWIQHDRELFPFAKSSERQIKNIRIYLETILRLRNRVFHHEPIWSDKNLISKHEDIYRLIRWINPKVASWIEENDRFVDIYNNLSESLPLR
jgi:Abi-like protein